MRVSRRGFFALGATVVVAGCSSDGDDAAVVTTGPPTTDRAPTTATTATAATTAPTTAPSTTAPPTTEASLDADPFALGVTSGDPDETSAVLWTRLVGVALPDEVDVRWELADDEAFSSVAASGQVVAIAADGHSVHAVVDLAAPAWYRFSAGGWTSRVGRVRPAPSGAVDELRLVTASCQHWETGFYAAHRDTAEWAPDLVVFLGDFLYENPGRPLGDGIVRSHDGAEPTDVGAYRARYAQYLSDPDLQAARAAAPWLVVWDDHEVENNYAALVPQDAADAAGFAERRAAAYRAWWEHMPVRLDPPGAAGFRIHRQVRWGELADLVMLDGRQFRSDQACGSPVLSTEPPCPEALDPARTMLGTDQEAWVGDTLTAATGAWSVLAQQTVLTDLRFNEAILNYDQWDGYAPARDRLLAQAAATDRLIVLTGDIHLAGVGLLPGLGVEFVTTAVSSTANVPADLQPILDAYPNVVASELVSRGCTRHTVTPSSWTAEYRTVDDVIDPASTVSTWRTFRVDASARDVVVAV